LKNKEIEVSFEIKVISMEGNQCGKCKNGCSGCPLATQSAEDATIDLSTVSSLSLDFKGAVKWKVGFLIESDGSASIVDFLYFLITRRTSLLTPL